MPNQSLCKKKKKPNKNLTNLNGHQLTLIPYLNTWINWIFKKVTKHWLLPAVFFWWLWDGNWCCKIIFIETKTFLFLFFFNLLLSRQTILEILLRKSKWKIQINSNLWGIWMKLYELIFKQKRENLWISTITVIVAKYHIHKAVHTNPISFYTELQFYYKSLKNMNSICSWQLICQLQIEFNL